MKTSMKRHWMAVMTAAVLLATWLGGNGAWAADGVAPGYSGNPIMPMRGICDPAVRIYGDKAHLYASHDTPLDAPERKGKSGFHMMDWWVWSSTNLVDWKFEAALDPAIFGFPNGFKDCWATDGASKNGKYYWYVCTPERTYVAMSDTPAGPWTSPLGNKPIMEGRDPSAFVDDDGTPYLVTGVWHYNIAKLNEDMVSLAEKPRKVEIINPRGPYNRDGKNAGRPTDDKPYLHKHKDWYYLSWGCYYGMSRNVYGPYECKGSVLLEEHIVPPMSQKGFDYDRHGSFFQWREQWYYIFNDQTATKSGYFRDSAIGKVEYLENGEIAPVRLTNQGVALPKKTSEFHVARNGKDSNSGTEATPFYSIQHAADLAQPGDVITVHKGVYRERINPPRGGESDFRRITYQSAPGETVEIKGSEVVKGWEKVQGDTWKVVLCHTFFGGFNPYADRLSGDWFHPRGRTHHTGAVYYNGDWLTEAATQEELFKPVDKTPLWFAQVDKEVTTIWAQFPNANPNEQQVEINVRRTVFYPDKPGRNYITVRGFTMRHAATPWAPPTAEQIGLIGTHWSKGWIIENNTISHSTCSGITLGKYGDEFDNKSSSADAYNKTIERALKNGWNRETIGHHFVRNNHISHCEQAGIVGSLGAVFSTISDNSIHDIHVRRLFSGCEQAGIKLHAAIDVEINHNHIYRCNRGLWLDWMAQGTRVINNLFHNNATDKVDWPKKWEANVPGGEQDIFLEVNHGPILIANNLLLSPYSINSRSQGVAFVHNLIAGAMRIVPLDGRLTPWHEPHATKVMGLKDHPMGDNRYYNNLFVERADLRGYDNAISPLWMDGNVFVHGAKPSRHETNPLVLPEFAPALQVIEKPDGWWLEVTLDKAWANQRTRSLVTTDLLGRVALPNMAFEKPDGSPIRINTDYFGKQRNEANPAPGPFENLESEKQAFKVFGPCE